MRSRLILIHIEEDHQLTRRGATQSRSAQFVDLLIHMPQDNFKLKGESSFIHVKTSLESWDLQSVPFLVCQF